MKFYFSAKWQLHETISQLQNCVVSQGHEIAADWTSRAYPRDYDKFGKSSGFANEELEAILESDFFVHISDLGGKGKYVDLGIALAGNKINSKPKVFVIGNPANESQFYFHKGVNRIITTDYFSVLEEILDKIQK